MLEYKCRSHATNGAMWLVKLIHLCGKKMYWQSSRIMLSHYKRYHLKAVHIYKYETILILYLYTYHPLDVFMVSIRLSSQAIHLIIVNPDYYDLGTEFLGFVSANFHLGHDSILSQLFKGLSVGMRRYRRHLTKKCSCYIILLLWSYQYWPRTFNSYLVIRNKVKVFIASCARCKSVEVLFLSTSLKLSTKGSIWFI